MNASCVCSQVSWIRHRDIHILTVGGYTYTSDQRFQANHHRDNEDWTLQIKWAQKRDAGVYECQISTQPVRSYFVNLNIVELSPRPGHEARSLGLRPVVLNRAARVRECNRGQVSRFISAGDAPYVGERR
ncbi:Uncharacterized protein GBIM_15887 [Gryllus bimaculatus]|nr:Uncharacterized protein GBIM_15887 [Gryllus bimaculatus]